MSLPKILVVDSDEGFGMMLKEGLAGSGYYTADWVQSGGDAAARLSQDNYDLLIVDIAITDMSPISLVQAARKAKPNLKVMMIPLMGQQMPKQVDALKLDGILTKPFFVGDLPDFVDKALGIERAPAPPPPEPEPAPAASPAAPAPAASGEAPPAEALPFGGVNIQVATVSADTISYLRASETEIVRILSDLNREVRAEAILLIAGTEMIAQAGMLGKDQCRQLSMLVAQSSQAAANAASFLGEQEKRFGQSLHEGSEYRLFTLTLSEGILLSLALSSNVPLGMIRHQSRQVGERLARFIG